MGSDLGSKTWGGKSETRNKVLPLKYEVKRLPVGEGGSKPKLHLGQQKISEPAPPAISAALYLFQ